VQLEKMMKGETFSTAATIVRAMTVRSGNLLSIAPNLFLFTTSLNRDIIYFSQGLLCFYGKKTAVIWNPTIRKSVVVHVPNVLGHPYETVLGFGVCPGTCDPTLVKITLDRSLGDTTADVFTSSTKTWKRLANSLPRKSIAFTKNQVVIDRFIYWEAFDTTNVDVGFGGCYVILSFDMITEQFKELKLQDTLAVDIISCMCISKSRESLAVVLAETVDKKEVICVWMMDNGDKQLFTKKFTINMPDEVNVLLGFRKSGEPIIEMIRDHIVLEDLFVYEPYSEHINCFGITVIEDSCDDYDNGNIANVDGNRWLLEQASTIEAHLL
nr:hypothetical protein [Tanacetum cinerariifolium]